MQPTIFKKNRVIDYAGLALLLVYGAIHCFKGNDFNVFLEAAERIKQGANIYDPLPGSLQYFYSPLFAILLWPFTFFPYWVGCLCWTAFSTFCLADACRLAMNYFDKKRLTAKQLVWWPRLIFLLALAAILDNYKMVQMTPFLLWGCLKSLQWIQGGKNLKAGALLALAVNIKLLPLFFIAYIIYRGHFKTFLFWILFSVVFIFLPVVFIGVQQNNFLLGQWVHFINPFSAVQTDMLFNKVDLGSAILDLNGNKASLAVGDGSSMNNEPNNALLSANIARLLFVFGTLFFLKTPPFSPAKNLLFQIWEVAYLTLLIPLLFPRQHLYAFVFLLPAFTYLVYFFMLKRNDYKILFWIFLVAALFLSPLLGRDVVGADLYDFFRGYKVSTISVVVLAVVLFFCGPGKVWIRGSND